MGLKKGMTNNPNGRPAGSQNKSTVEIKNILTEFISKNIETLQNDYDSLEPKERLIFIEKLLKYIIPTKTTNEIDISKMSDEEVDKLAESILKNYHNES